MDTKLRLLSDWQHDFPLSATPFADIARHMAVPEAEVLSQYTEALKNGSLSRIGGVFAPQAGGDSLLAAIAVPAERLDAVAAIVSSHPGVNHNYAREHPINLWFVMTGSTRDRLEQDLQALERQTGLRILRLRMLQPYRIDLGFALDHEVALRPARSSPSSEAGALSAADHALAALVEQGLPIGHRPYVPWGSQLGRSEADILETLGTWLQKGQLKRFGVVVRHHELGYAANAMTVFDVPDEAVDACGLALAAQPGVTLAYRRTRDEGWPYNLYAMAHGKQRQTVQEIIERMTRAAGLSAYPRQVLFSTVRYKQTGGRRFGDMPLPPSHSRELAHVVCG